LLVGQTLQQSGVKADGSTGHPYGNVIIQGEGVLNIAFCPFLCARTGRCNILAGSSQLFQRGKRILGHELAGLIERALS